MIGLLVLSSLAGVVAPLLAGFHIYLALRDVLGSPRRRTARVLALPLAAVAGLVLLGWLALVPVAWVAYATGKGAFETLAPLGLNIFCLVIELPLLPRALRRRCAASRLAELSRVPGLEQRFRYPAVLERWVQGEHQGYPVVALPVEPVRGASGWLWRRLHSGGDALDSRYARQPGMVVLARARADHPASLEIHSAAALALVNRTRIFAQALPSAPSKVESGYAGFDQNVHVHAAERDRSAAQRLGASPAARERLAALLGEHPMIYARATRGAGMASLLGGRALDPPFERPGFVVVEWLPMPRTVDDVLVALDAVVSVAQVLDSAVPPTVHAATAP